MSNCLANKPAPTPFSSGLNAMNHLISIATAVDMVNNFNAVREAMTAGFPGNDTLPVYETFNLKAIHDLLIQPKAVGFRIYLGLDASQQVRFVLAGVDSDGMDIIKRYQENPGGNYSPTQVSVLVDEQGQRWP